MWEVWSIMACRDKEMAMRICLRDRCTMGTFVNAKQVR